MINTNNIKVAFFDVDGVLSVPRYKYANQTIHCGMAEVHWFSLCNQCDDIYQNCVPPKQVIKLLKKLKKDNVILYVLTQETHSGGYFNKLEFINKHYSEFFNSYKQVLFVSDAKDKLRMIETLADKHTVNLSSCLLVDDTFQTCIEADIKGIKAMHISELFVD